jgi:hypothetical protein
VNVEAAVYRVPAAESSIERQLVAAVENAELRRDPFDHIYMRPVLDPASYEALLQALPNRSSYRELKHRDALREDGSSTRLRMYLFPELVKKLPVNQQQIWLPVARALRSRALELALKRKFRAALEERFGKSVEKIGLFPIPILLRDQPGYRIGIHADKDTKAITVQFYLPRDHSQEKIGTIFHEADDGPGASRTTQMQFLPSSGYAFPVSLTKSWHSAATTTESDGERVSMMVTYYIADNFAARLYWQARRALLWLGIHPER